MLLMPLKDLQAKREDLDRSGTGNAGYGFFFQISEIHGRARKPK